MQLLGVYIIIAMTFEGVLKNIFATGRDDDTIAHIRCSPLFSVHNIPFYLIILKKPAELRSKRMWIIPICLNSHWFCVVRNAKNRSCVQN